MHLADCLRPLAPSLLIPTIGLTVLGCGSNPTESVPSVATVAVTPASATLASVGETVQLTATAQDGDNNPVTGRTFTWTSSNVSVATVTSGGLVTAVGNGTASITASTDGVSGSASITVADMTPPETTIDNAVPSTLVAYDLTSDWSDLSNPNGAWTYREGLNALPHVADWTPLNSTVAQPAWSRLGTDPNFLPAWFRSASDNPSGFDFLSGDVVVHSTDTFRGPMGDANVAWTSPVDGTADIAGAVWMVREIGRGNTWQLSLNDNALTSGHVSSGDPFSRAVPFDFSSGSGGGSALSDISVTAGDEIRLDFRADDPSFGGDFVGMNLTITIADEATFAFSSSESGSSFECQLDGSGFSACTSPAVFTGLGAGDHSFEVRATDPAGNVDATPAEFNWTVAVTSPRNATVKE